MKKRLFGILLALAMMLGMIPGMSVNARAEVTQWLIGDKINLNGKWFNPDDWEPNRVYLGIDQSSTVQEAKFEDPVTQWCFKSGIYSTDSLKYVHIRLPQGKTESEKPSGFRIKGGTGVKDDPYTFELVYQKDIDDAKTIAQAMDEVHPRTGSGMTATGSPIQLIDPPSTSLPEGYTMVYAVTETNTAPAATAYTATVPSRSDAGTYYVWVGVRNKNNLLVTEPVSVTVTIEKPVPKTGDSGHPALWIGLAILGLVGILAAAARKVRKDPAARG